MAQQLANLLSLHGQTAIVTGSSDGIGLGVATAFVHAGANVVLHGRSSEKLQHVLDSFASSGHSSQVKIVTGDINVDKVRQELISAAVTNFGGLNILVNNAGIYRPSPLDKISEEQFNESVHTNTLSPLLLIRDATPHLVKSKGSIINLSSIAANSHLSIPQHSIYEITKSDLHAITRSLAVELGPQGVRVNTISPGLIPTSMTSDIPVPVQEILRDRYTPLRKTGSTTDIGNVALFLASQLSSFVTGNDIVVDGGIILGNPFGYAFADFMRESGAKKATQ